MEDVIQRYLSKNIDMLILGLVKENEINSQQVTAYEMTLQLWRIHGILKQMSAVYSVLHRLERDGLLSREIPSWKLKTTYTLTETGEEVLTQYLESLLKFKAVRRIVKGKLK